MTILRIQEKNRVLAILLRSDLTTTSRAAVVVLTSPRDFGHINVPRQNYQALDLT